MPHALVGFSNATKGRVGAVVYAKSPQGSPYIASRIYQPHPYNPKSFAQRFRRTALDAANKLFHNLTIPVVKANWLGKRGKGRIKLSAWNAFCMKALLNATMAWGPQLTPAPTPSTPVAGVVITAVPGVKMVTLT